ncbi:MAG TPA: VOC family protein [Acidimicrobiales bacterium]|nr:VOC family protein [Acidimicrobiales bacterium]
MSEQRTDKEGQRDGGMISGLHHIRIPVRDAWSSRDWYMSVLGFAPLMDVEEERALVGVVLKHPVGLVVGLHQDPVRAEAMHGFALLGLTVKSKEHLELLAAQLDHSDVHHGPIEEGHLGHYFDLPDPDGIVTRFHAGSIAYTEEA